MTHVIYNSKLTPLVEPVSCSDALHFHLVLLEMTDFLPLNEVTNASVRGTVGVPLLNKEIQTHFLK